MPNINLATEDVLRNNPSPIGKGLIFSVLILVAVFMIYAGLITTNKVLSSKIAETKGEYDAQYGELLLGDGNKIIDFENRSTEANKMIAEDASMAGMLSQMEKTMLPAVYLNSVKYDDSKKMVSLVCVGDNFQTVAKQVLSFKQNEYFSKVIPGRVSLDLKENNKLNFSIDLVIK